MLLCAAPRGAGFAVSVSGAFMLASRSTFPAKAWDLLASWQSFGGARWNQSLGIDLSLVCQMFWVDTGTATTFGSSGRRGGRWFQGVRSNFPHAHCFVLDDLYSY